MLAPLVPFNQTTCVFSKKSFLFGVELAFLLLGFTASLGVAVYFNSTARPSKRLAIARAMSSCTSKMSFSSRSNRSDQRW